jgi:succinoglycan biosynthesis protein ExoM
MTLPRISVCLATYRRPQRLGLVLRDLARQTLRPTQIVVVDNDADRSGEPAVHAFKAELDAVGAPLDVVYDTQFERNISLTRNRTVALADGEWLAFIDDDERAPDDWLQRLYDTARQFQADGVLAPVVPQVPEHAPAWIRKGDFYSFPRLPTGQTVPLNQLRFGNALLRAEPVRTLPGPFDPAFKLSTGEDADMLLRFIRRGCTVIWDDLACVTEPVEAARLSFAWLLQRAYSGGQEFARKALTGAYGPMDRTQRLKLAANAVAKLVSALLLAVLTLPLGRHRAAHWLIRAKANQGKLSAFRGVRYQEYAAN